MAMCMAVSSSRGVCMCKRVGVSLSLYLCVLQAILMMCFALKYDRPQPCVLPLPHHSIACSSPPAHQIQPPIEICSSSHATLCRSTVHGSFLCEMSAHPTFPPRTVVLLLHTMPECAGAVFLLFPVSFASICGHSGNSFIS